jgi:hypothetical protein
MNAVVQINAQLMPHRARRGFGAANALGSVELAAMNALILSGNGSLSAGQYGAAVSAYQAAADYGVANLSPLIQGQPLLIIDGYYAVIKTINNSSLPVVGATMAGAWQAQGLVQSMYTQYSTALQSTTTTTPAGKPPAPPATTVTKTTGPAGATAPTTSSKTPYYVAGGVAVAALGTGAWWLYVRK